MLKRHTTFRSSTYTPDAVQLLAGVDDPRVSTILQDCLIGRVAAGDTLHSAEACVYVVLRGALGAAAPQQAHGNISHILPGESIGELAVLDDASHSTILTALQDSELLVIEAGTLWQLIDHVPGVARNLLRLLSFRLRTVNAQLRRGQKVGEFYRQLSMIDGLTGLHNRAWLDDRLAAMIGDAHAGNRPLAAIMMDVDYFKRFNDRHGHLAGDDALRIAANVLSAALRPTDFAARYGGEELFVILPDSSEKAGIMVAERLCQRMREAIVFADMRAPLPHVTASFGVAALAPGQDASALIAKADAALYRAKDAGRDCVAC